VAFAAAVLGGCDVSAPENATEAPARNECSSDDHCRDGRCDDGLCRAVMGRFRSVLFLVTPPADAEGIAGVRFFRPVDDLSLAGGALNLELDHISRVTGSVLTAAGEAADCADREPAGEDEPSPGVLGRTGVVFTPSEWVYGLTAPSYVAELTLAERDGAALDTFSVNVPPGQYDIYVEPAVLNGSCRTAPQLFRDQLIDAGDVKLELMLTPASRLDVSLPWPLTEPELEGWTVDLIDPVSGRALSASVALGESDVDDARRLYAASLEYSPVAGSTDSVEGSELVRLVPPTGLAAPTLLVERSGVELSERGIGELPPFQRLPSVVELDGRVTVAGTAESTPATVTLTARSLNELESGVFGSYTRTVETDEDGRFRVEALPGTYRVLVVPPGESGLSATGIEWEVGSERALQGGRTIELEPSASIRGTVVGLAGEPAVGVPVHAIAFPSKAQVGALVEPLGDDPFVPRASSAVAGLGGRFEVLADPGSFNVSVRPPEGSGFAWMVSPNVLVGPKGEDLGSLLLPLPLAYRGRVTAPGAGVVGGALIRAYIYMDAENLYTTDPGQVATVLQIGETRSNGTGAFELLLPSQLN
jgi:hypothetical protein